MSEILFVTEVVRYLADPIFPFVPTVEANAFQTLLRFLAGMEDFARVHSQHPRIDKTFCTYKLRDFPKRRICLFCWHYRKWLRVALFPGLSVHGRSSKEISFSFGIFGSGHRTAE